MNKLEALCKEFGFKMEFIRGRTDSLCDLNNPWTVTISRKVDSKELIFTVGYSTNGKKAPDYHITYAERKVKYSNYFPIMHDVIASCLSEIHDVNCYSSFEDWADGFGCDWKDSIKAKYTFELMQRTAKNFKKFLGNDLETFMNAWKTMEGVD